MPNLKKSINARLGASVRDNFSSLALCLVTALALGLTVGCGESASTSSANNEAVIEPTVEVILGDSERGAKDGIGPMARFQGVTALCTLTPERIALSDTFAGTIRLLDLQTSEVTTLAGSADEVGVVDGPLAQARFTSPRGIGCLPDGTGLVVADDGALRYIDLVANQVTTVAGGSGAHGYEDGSAVRARTLHTHTHTHMARTRTGMCACTCSNSTNPAASVYPEEMYSACACDMKA